MNTANTTIDLSTAIDETDQVIFVCTDGFEYLTWYEEATDLLLAHAILSVIGFEIVRDTVKISINATRREMVDAMDAYYASLDRDANGWDD